MSRFTRREFLQTTSAGVAALSLPGTLDAAPSPVAPPKLAVISGSPEERGRKYGQFFQKSIHAFFENEIEKAFIGQPSTREEMADYARRCGDVVERQLPEIHAELTGMAAGSGLSVDQLVLLSAHEELWHRGVLPAHEHCTAVAVGPPDTRDGRTYVGQTWDWMKSVAGLSGAILWQRDEGPSLLAYGYPGLWVGAGLNSSGLALCWTSASDDQRTPRVGVPSYLYLANLLYQPSLDAVLDEAKRVTHAGWFTFVMADGEGRLLNVEGSPRELACEEHSGTLARVLYGSRQMTMNKDGSERLKVHARCRHTESILAGARGKIDGKFLQEVFADPALGICQGAGTIDMMVFDLTGRRAWLSRGADYGVDWKAFAFAEALSAP